jgi:hypothetical protein
MRAQFTTRSGSKAGFSTSPFLVTYERARENMEILSSSTQRKISYQGAAIPPPTEEAIKQFAQLFFRPGYEPPKDASLEVYRQSVSESVMYEGRYIEFLSNVLSSQIKNNRNLFMIACVAPQFVTDEEHFRVHHKEWNALLYTSKAEGGLSNEPTYSQWVHTDDLGPIYEQTTPISIRLGRNHEFGYQTWMENIQELYDNMVYTLMDGAIRNIVHTAFTNMAGDWMKKSFDLSRLFATEAFSTFICATDPRGAFDMLMRFDESIPGMNTVIGPKRFTRYFNTIGEQGAPRQLEWKTLEYDEVEKRLKARVLPGEGPFSVKTYQFGGKLVDFLETEPFTINSKDPHPRDPMETQLTLCQMFPPNPMYNPCARVCSISPDILDIYIANQSETSVVETRITFCQRLRNCWYWNPQTGEFSEYLKNYIKELNSGKGEGAPWQFQRGVSDDVNNDIGDYNVPNEYAKNSKGDLSNMRTFRHKSVVVFWDTRDQTYKVVKDVGGNHLDTLTNEQILFAVESVAVAFEKKYGIKAASVLDEVIAWLENVRKAPIKAEYIQKLIDRNMRNQMVDGEFSPSMRNGFPEFRGNMNGGLDLPDNDDFSLTGVKYFNGFHSGPGMATAADWDTQPGNAYHQMATEARSAMAKVNMLVEFIRETLGEKCGVIDPKNTKPWYDTEDAAAVLVDAIFPGQIPVFLGVPSAGDFDNDSSRMPENVLPSSALRTFLLATDLSAGLAEIPDGYSGSSVDAAIEALSCLSGVTAEKYKAQILFSSQIQRPKGSSAFTKAFQAASDKLFAFIIATSGYPETILNGTEEVRRRNRKIVSAVTEKFFAELDAIVGGGDLPEEEITKATNAAILWTKLTAKTLPKYMSQLENTDAYKSEALNFAPALIAFQRRVTTGAGRRPVSENERSASVAARQNERMQLPGVNYFEGVYDTVIPTNYMRSPLVSSPTLVEFIRQTGFMWAVPADPASGYTTPNTSVVNRAPTQRANNLRAENIALPFLLSGFHAKLGNLIRTNARSSPPQQPEQRSRSSSVSSAGVDLSSRHHHGGKKKRTAATLYADLGKQRSDMDADDDEMMEDPVTKKQVPSTFYYDKAMEEELERREYYGPWAARAAFCKDLSNSFMRLIFRAICETPNKLEVHEKLAAIGAQLIDFIMFRCGVSFLASSIIVMRRGEDVTATAMSEPMVDLSKEARGFFHLRCQFRFGHVNVAPEMIQALWYAIPGAYLGGKKCDFITNPKQLNVHDVNRPSIFCLPIAVGERQFADSLDMTRANYWRTPGRSDQPDWMRTYSASGFFVSIIGHTAANLVRALHNERYRYTKAPALSFCAHRGPCSFIDPATMKKIDYEGFGPGNARSQNIAGAELVHLGKRDYFPQPHDTIINWQRAM